MGICTLGILDRQKTEEKMSKFKIEVCALSVQSAINAAAAGAYRVELCDNYFEGGTTPGPGTIELARKNIPIKLNVLIRPRGGDFLYSGIELETMLKDIYAVKNLNGDGIAVGVLRADGKIDRDIMKEIIALAHPMSVTFHRAFDNTADPFEALETLIELGADRILTSGGAGSAMQGKDIIASLVQKAGGRIIIMPGAGINDKNIKELALLTGAVEFHLSAKSIVESKMVQKGNVDFTYELPYGAYIESSREKIKKTVDTINNL